MASTSTGPSSNLQNNLQDKAKVTAAMIQELTEKLQSIDQESLNDEQDSEVTQESDLEQEESEDCSKLIFSKTEPIFVEKTSFCLNSVNTISLH